MVRYLLYCFSIFFVVLEVILILYMLQGFFRMGHTIRLFFIMLVYPMLAPMQRIFKYSILNTYSIDLSPYITLIILNYCYFLCDMLLQ
ncbi:MAG: YggT family protein [Lachnospiraceae bacterium]|nr:YggT family protein [Lachnospiraceae bacterium]